MNLKLLFIFKHRHSGRVADKNYPGWKMWRKVLLTAFLSILVFIRYGERKGPPITINFFYVEMKPGVKAEDPESFDVWQELKMGNELIIRKKIKNLAEQREIQFFLDYLFKHAYPGVWWLE